MHCLISRFIPVCRVATVWSVIKLNFSQATCLSNHLLHSFILKATSFRFIYAHKNIYFTYAWYMLVLETCSGRVKCVSSEERRPGQHKFRVNRVRVRVISHGIGVVLSFLSLFSSLIHIYNLCAITNPSSRILNLDIPLVLFPQTQISGMSWYSYPSDTVFFKSY